MSERLMRKVSCVAFVSLLFLISVSVVAAYGTDDGFPVWTYYLEIVEHSVMVIISVVGMYSFYRMYVTKRQSVILGLLWGLGLFGFGQLLTTLQHFLLFPFGIWTAIINHGFLLVGVGIFVKSLLQYFSYQTISSKTTKVSLVKSRTLVKKQEIADYLAYGALFIALVGLIFAGYSIYTFFFASTPPVTSPAQVSDASTSSVSSSSAGIPKFNTITDEIEYFKAHNPKKINIEEAINSMDKDHDGWCDTCGMPIASCIEQGMTTCMMG